MLNDTVQEITKACNQYIIYYYSTGATASKRIVSLVFEIMHEELRFVMSFLGLYFNS